MLVYAYGRTRQYNKSEGILMQQWGDLFEYLRFYYEGSATIPIW